MGRMGRQEAVQTREEVQAEKKCTPGGEVHTEKKCKKEEIAKRGKTAKKRGKLQKREEEQNRKQCAKREAYSSVACDAMVENLRRAR